MRRNASRLVLGTAQLGMAYGVANATVLLPDEKQALLRLAVAKGVYVIDTARAYGQSEAVVGKFLKSDGASSCRVVTKLSPLAELSRDADSNDVRAAVEHSLLQSRRALGMSQLHTVLLHRASQLYAWNRMAWYVLRDLVDRGAIQTIGVSVQTPEELTLALNTPDVSHIQLPFNIMDWRWDHLLPRLREVREQRRLVVHVRSLLLQGLFVTARRDAWIMAGVAEPETVQAWLGDQARQLARKDIADLSIAYANAQDWLDGLVIGIDNKAQLQANLELMEKPPLSAADIDQLLRSRPRLTDGTLDPAKWRRGE